MRIDLRQWWRLPLKLRFLLAGAFNTAFGYGVFAVLYLAFGHAVNYLLIGLLSHSIAACVAFLVHRRLVFQSREPWGRSFLRFNLSQLAALGFSLCALYSLVEFAGLNPLAAQPIVVVSTVLLSYVLHRHFSFRGGSVTP